MSNLIDLGHLKNREDTHTGVEQFTLVRCLAHHVTHSQVGGYKVNMGGLSWTTDVMNVHPPELNVKCTANGPSFATLQYVE